MQPRPSGIIIGHSPARCSQEGEAIDTASAFDTGFRAAEELRSAARLLFLSGSMLGPDRVEGASAFGHGDDTLVSLSMTCEIGADLISGATALLAQCHLA